MNSNPLHKIINDEMTRFEQLCYQVFIVSDDGKALWECIKDQHLMVNKVDAAEPNCNQIALFDAGMREAFLGLYRFAENYQAKQLMRVTNE